MRLICQRRKIEILDDFRKIEYANYYSYSFEIYSGKFNLPLKSDSQHLTPNLG